MQTLFTIGYATKPIEQFIEQCRHHQIDVIADVRSVPYSKAFYDYHQEAIRQTLREHGIRYVYLGEELGPRSKDDRHYNKDGQVQFDRLMVSTLFQQGIERLVNGMQKNYRIALMCAEKDPAICHRSLLIGYHLIRDQQLTIEHIHHNDERETQQQLEQRLTTTHKLEQDLFLSDEQCLQQAYQMQIQQYAYIKES